VSAPNADSVRLECPQCLWQSRAVEVDYELPNALWYAKNSLMGEYRRHRTDEHWVPPTVLQIDGSGAS
jgi:hypothetical protein